MGPPVCYLLTLPLPYETMQKCRNGQESSKFGNKTTELATYPENTDQSGFQKTSTHRVI